MYNLIYIDNSDGKTYKEYFFFWNLGPRIFHLWENPNRYKILWILPLCFSFSVIKKCIAKKVQCLDKQYQ